MSLIYNKYNIIYNLYEYDSNDQQNKYFQKHTELLKIFCDSKMYFI